MLERVLDDAGLRSVQDRNRAVGIGYPRSRRPGFANAVPEQIWNMILIDLENGAVATPFRALLTSALRDQPHNRVFRLLAQRYGVDPTAG
ncbi:effector-associated domain EAD1-containing protein [Frankia sp. Cas8]|uniref:effector-associated domain EAD1-containing protein n=1 Tax=unclassified Frankia TaxID=2632575 RepID=UPI003A0FC80F